MTTREVPKEQSVSVEKTESAKSPPSDTELTTEVKRSVVTAEVDASQRGNEHPEGSAPPLDRLTQDN